MKVETDENNQECPFNVEKYKLLYDYMKFQHTRYADYTRAFLISNSIILSACGFLLQIKVDAMFVTWLSVLGALLTLIWVGVIRRVMLDADLRWFQLRELERILGEPNGLFNTGDKFFKTYKITSAFPTVDKTDNDSFEETRMSARMKLRHSVGLYLPACFTLFFFTITWYSTLGIFDRIMVCLYYALFITIFIIFDRRRKRSS
jgi:hypothetical protein